MTKKISAQDYFKDSPLFTAQIVDGKPSASHSSSSVYYELTCKECGHKAKRRGNTASLLKCQGKGCGRTWDREAGTVIGGAATRGMKRKIDDVFGKKPVEEKQEEKPEEEPHEKPQEKVQEKVQAKMEPKPVDEVVAPARSASHYMNLIVNASKKGSKTSDVGDVTDILDHCDEYTSDGKWHRFYYSLWWGSPDAHFARDDSFAKPTLINAYEAKLDDSEKFKTKFPNPRSRYKNKTFRTKEDVYRDAGVDEDKDEAPKDKLNVVKDDGETVQIRVTKIMTFKKGESIVAPDGFTYERL